MRVSLGLGATAFMVLAMISVAPAADGVDVSGKWSGRWTVSPFGGPCTLEFVQKGRELTGEVYVGERPASPPSYTAPLKGSVKGETVEFSYTPPDLQTRYTVSFEGKVSGNTLTGTASGGGRNVTFAVKRGQ